MEHLLDAVAGAKSERLDRLHTRMAEIDFTPTPRRPLSESECDEGFQDLEESFAVYEIQGAHKANDEASRYKPDHDCAGDEMREGILQMTERDVEFSALFPEVGIGIVSLLPWSGVDDLQDLGQEEISYGFPADIFGLESHIPPIPAHAAEFSSAAFEI